MAEEATKFVEVTCTSSGKIRRFAAGTNAGFAVNSMNRSLATGACRAFCIEAVKKGEERVSFGPNSVLDNYGNGWKLRTNLMGAGEEKLLQSVPDSTKRSNPGQEQSGQTLMEVIEGIIIIFITYVFVMIIAVTADVFPVIMLKVKNYLTASL